MVQKKSPDDLGAMPIAAVPVLHFGLGVAKSALGTVIGLFAVEKIKSKMGAPALPAKTSGVADAIEGLWEEPAQLGAAASLKKDCGCDDCRHGAAHGRGDEPCTMGCPVSGTDDLGCGDDVACGCATKDDEDDLGWARRILGYDVTAEFSVKKAADSPEQAKLKADADKAVSNIDKLKAELDKVKVTPKDDKAKTSGVDDLGSLTDDLFSATSQGGHAFLKVFTPGIADDVQKITHKAKREVDIKSGHGVQYDPLLDDPPPPKVNPQRVLATPQKKTELAPPACAPTTTKPGQAGTTNTKGIDMSDMEGEDLGASTAAYPGHITLRKGQTYVAKRDGDWVVYRGTLKNWILKRCGKPGALARAKRHVRRLQKVGVQLRGQVDMLRGQVDQLTQALIACGNQVQVPDVGPMLDIPTDPMLDADFAQLDDAGIDDPGFGDDDFVNGVSGLDGVFPEDGDLGATRAQDKAHIRRLQRMSHAEIGEKHHLQNELRRMRAELHQCREAHKRGHATPAVVDHARRLALLIPAVEHALEQAVHTIAQDNRILIRSMHTPDGLNGAEQAPNFAPPSPPANVGSAEDVGRGPFAPPRGGGFHGGPRGGGWGNRWSPGWGGSPFVGVSVPADPYFVGYDGDPDMMMGAPQGGAKPPSPAFGPPSPPDDLGACGGSCPDPDPRSSPMTRLPMSFRGPGDGTGGPPN